MADDSIASQATRMAAARARMADRQGTLTRKVEWLKAYLVHALRSTGTDKVKGQLLTIALRTAPVSCEVVDVEAVPAEYKREHSCPKQLLKELRFGVV